MKYRYRLGEPALSSISRRRLGNFVFNEFLFICMKWLVTRAGMLSRDEVGMDDWFFWLAN